MNDCLCVLYDETGREARAVLEDGYFQSTGVGVRLGALRASVARTAPTGALRARVAASAAPWPWPHRVAARGTLCTAGARGGVAAAGAALALHAPHARALELAGAWEPAAARTRAALCARGTVLSAALAAARVHAPLPSRDSSTLVAAEAVLRPTAGLALALCAAGMTTATTARGRGTVAVDGRVAWTRGAWAVLARVEQHGRAAGATVARVLAGGRTRVAVDTLFALPRAPAESAAAAPAAAALWGLVHRGCASASATGGSGGRGETCVAVGVEHRPDADTLLRARLDTRCVLRAVCSRRVAPACTQAFAFTVNLADLSRAGGHVAAFSLAFGG